MVTGRSSLLRLRYRYGPSTNSPADRFADEIETHLHPAWKLEIVTRLRRVFLRLHFLATTHDPLCLRGLQSGEVVVLRRSGRRHIGGIHHPKCRSSPRRSTSDESTVWIAHDSRSGVPTQDGSLLPTADNPSDRLLRRRGDPPLTHGSVEHRNQSCEAPSEHHGAVVLSAVRSPGRIMND